MGNFTLATGSRRSAFCATVADSTASALWHPWHSPARQRASTARASGEFRLKCRPNATGHRATVSQLRAVAGQDATSSRPCVPQRRPESAEHASSIDIACLTVNRNSAWVIPRRCEARGSPHLCALRFGPSESRNRLRGALLCSAQPVCISATGGRPGMRSAVDHHGGNSDDHDTHSGPQRRRHWNAGRSRRDSRRNRASGRSRGTTRWQAPGRPGPRSRGRSGRMVPLLG
jgi:hypothetical protein